MKTLCFSLFIACILFASPALARDQWSIEKANAWYQSNNWFIGCNFVPSTAVNTLEMWQAETYDPTTIDRELGFAQSTGFNIIRVFLHHLVWQQDPTGFKNRLSNFLSIADSHKIKTMLVLFDDCWNAEGKLGKQPEPTPGVHNSQWVQAPGAAEITDTTLYPIFEAYVKDIISTFSNDNRVVVWDIYNEPGNSAHVLNTLPLLTNVFQWARDANPSQPITSGPWNWGSDFDKLIALQTGQSDIVTFHVYTQTEDTKNIINKFKAYNRPTICTEYMARSIGSLFQTHVPLFHDQDVGCINWGLVKGRTNTIFPWNSPEGTPEPKVWFHDVLHPDGTPFDQEEIDVIKKYAAKAARTPAFLDI